MEKDNKKMMHRKLLIATVVYSVLASIPITLIIFAMLIYGFNINNNSTRRIANLVHFPAAICGNKVITISDLEQKMSPIKEFYAKKSSDNTDKMLKIKEKYLLNKMIENAIIEREIQSRGIELSLEALSQETASELERYGEADEVKKTLRSEYGWSVADFQENVVRPELYRKKLLENIKLTDPSYADGKRQIELALAELKKDKDFDAVVKKYSQGSSVANQGDLGWFTSTELLPEVATVGFALGENKTSEIIESSLGYHIIKVTGKKIENKQDKIKLSQVFIKTKTIDDYLQEYEKDTKIYIPLKDFYWNADKKQVDFSDDNFDKFESSISNDFPQEAQFVF